MTDKKTKLVGRRPVDPRRHYQIAMVMASLVAGLLTLFNLDRTVNAKGATEIGHYASQHGWPAIYLQRTFKDDVPIFIRHELQWDWPFPAIQGEHRAWNVANLITNILVGAMIVTIVYWFVRTVVLRFDAKRTKTSQVE